MIGPPNQKQEQIATSENLAHRQRFQGYISRDELTESALDAEWEFWETHDKANSSTNE